MSAPREVIPGRIYLVTRRCTQRQFLLRPDKATNNAFAYCLGYAANRTAVQVVAFIANSNHYHAVVVDVEGRIPQFLEEFHKLLAKHQNALRGRWENFWSTEQTSLVELVGPEDVLAKVIYTITNPAKDHLVKLAKEWPGATSLGATITGGSVTARRPTRFFRREGPMPESVEFDCVLPPTHEHLTRDEFGQIVRAQIAAVEDAAAAERRLTGRRVLGWRAILTQLPTDRPQSHEPRRKLDPRIAACDKWPHIEAIRRLKAFRCDYANQRQAWLEGQDVVFPPGTWWLRKFAMVRCTDPVAPG